MSVSKISNLNANSAANFQDVKKDILDHLRKSSQSSNSNSKLGVNSNSANSDAEAREKLMKDLRDLVDEKRKKGHHIETFGLDEEANKQFSPPTDVQPAPSKPSPLPKSRVLQIIDKAAAPVLGSLGALSLPVGIFLKRADVKHQTFWKRNREAVFEKNALSGQLQKAQGLTRTAEKNKREAINNLSKTFNIKVDETISSENLAKSFLDKKNSIVSPVTEEIDRLQKQSTINNVLANKEFTFLTANTGKFNIEKWTSNFIATPYIVELQGDINYRMRERLADGSKGSSITLFDEKTFSPNGRASVVVGKSEAFKSIEYVHNEAIKKSEEIKKTYKGTIASRSITPELPGHSKAEDILNFVNETKRQRGLLVQDLKKKIAPYANLDASISSLKTADESIKIASSPIFDLSQKIKALDGVIAEKPSLVVEYVEKINKGELAEAKVNPSLKNILENEAKKVRSGKMLPMSGTFKFGRFLKRAGIALIALGALKVGYDQFFADKSVSEG